MRRHLTALLVAGLLLGACGDDDDSGDRAAATSIPERTSTSTSTTTEPRTVAPDVIPQDESQITEEYVEQVLNELLRASLESMLLARDAGVVDQPSLDLIAATTSDAVFETRVNDLLELAASDFSTLRSSPGPIQATVVAVLDADVQCIVAEIETDASALVIDPAPPQPEQRNFVRLLAASEAELESGLNATAWVLDEFPVSLDGSMPDVGCQVQ